MQYGKYLPLYQLHSYVPVERHYYSVLRLISVFIHLHLNTTLNGPILDQFFVL